MFVFGQQRPDDAGILGGERHDSHFGGAAGEQPGEPRVLLILAVTFLAQMR